MAGNRLGARVRIVYQTDDTNVLYILETDSDFQLAGLGVGAAAPALYNPATDYSPQTICPAPKKFKPRTVFAQSTTDGARKELICAHPTGELYATSQSKAVPSLDGDTTFVTTGRKGEKLSF